VVLFALVNLFIVKPVNIVINLIQDTMIKYIERLTKEWLQHGKIILAVDFDSTLSPWETIDNSEDIERCIGLVKQAQYTGSYIVIFTACNPERYSEILKHCESKGIHVDAINENPIVLQYGNQRKIYFNHLLDDRGGFLQAMDILETAMYKVRGIRITDNVNPNNAE